MYDDDGRYVELRPVAPVPAYGGRSERADAPPVVEFDARLLLPKPWGARPESVVLPCAFQLRPAVELLLPGRLELLNEPPARAELVELYEPVPVRPDCVADGGRFAASCEARFELTFEAPLLLNPERLAPLNPLVVP